MDAIEPSAADVGDRIRRAREEVGLPRLLDLALRVECSEATLWKYEHGKHLPSAAMLVRLADALGVSVDWLLVGDSHPAPEAA